jgi:hypothetical protein
MTDFNDYFIYLNEWKVLVCRCCKYGLRKNGVPRHLSGKHKVIPKVIRKALVKHTQTLAIVLPEEIQTPSTSIPAFECLELISDGCRCTKCNALYGTVDSMIVHCRNTHDWIQGQGIVHKYDL